MPRFIVLLHETPASYPRGTHFDLMLENGGVLRTWALDKLPACGESVTAEPLPDHRLDYLDYEGAVAGERGFVSRVAAGEYHVIEDTSGTIVISIRGGKLQGTIRLSHDSDDPQRWRVSLSPG
jgi:hypothetical protein